MATIKDFSQLDLNGVYSYADYLTWKFEQTLEIIKGKIFPMVAPNPFHQDIVLYIGSEFLNFIEKGKCKVYVAPFDVRLYDRKKSLKTDKDVYTVVQPDVCVVCNLSKIDNKGCLGAPDLIVEILSPGNSKREMKIKKDLYAESGVKEYWVVDPNSENIFRFSINESGEFDNPTIFVSDEVMPSVIFPEFKLDLKELFPEQEEN